MMHRNMASLAQPDSAGVGTIIGIGQARMGWRHLAAVLAP
jgi:hypothetical protein